MILKRSFKVLEIITTNQFEKDLKRSKKRGKDLSKIWKIIDVLAKKEPLAEKHKPHKLSGNWNDFFRVPYSARLATNLPS